MITSSPSKDPAPKQQAHIDLMFRNHLQITWRAGLYTTVPVLLLGGLGRWIDSLTSTLPLFLILGCLSGFVIGLYIVYISVSSLTK